MQYSVSLMEPSSVMTRESEGSKRSPESNVRKVRGDFELKSGVRVVCKKQFELWS